jgi:hypothetical protein
VFVIFHGLQDGIREYATFKATVAAANCDPASVRVAPASYVCVGETEAAAQDKRSIIEGTAREIDALVLLSEVLNYDFASKPIDEPFTDAELTEFSFQGFRDRVIRLSGKRTRRCAISSASPDAAPSRSTRCFAAARSRWPIRWRNALPRQLAMGSCWRLPTCRARMTTWCGY